MIRVDFIDAIEKGEDYHTKCDCCGKSLKNAYVCMKDDEHITLGKACLYNATKLIRRYKHDVWVKEVKAK